VVKIESVVAFVNCVILVTGVFATAEALVVYYSRDHYRLRTDIDRSTD